MHKVISSLYKQTIFCFISVFVFCFLAPAQISAAVKNTHPESGYSCYLDDAADFLTAGEEDALMERMLQIARYCNVAFATSTDHPYASAEGFAVNTFEQNFGTSSSGICFVIDRDCNEIYLISEGAMRKTITSGRCNSITDNTYIYATSGHGYDYYTCAYKTFEQVLTLLQGGKIAQPMKHICNLLLALILAMLINYFIVMSFAHAQKPSNGELLSGLFTKVDIKNPSTHFTRQTKKYSPQSSGNSGGGGSGGGGGGGHSGGGHSI